MTDHVAEVLQNLWSDPRITKTHPLTRAEAGTRVVISVKGVTAYGTIADRAAGGSLKRANVISVVLDGTDERIEVDAHYCKEIES
jgi:hypothetical protein